MIKRFTLDIGQHWANFERLREQAFQDLKKEETEREKRRQEIEEKHAEELLKKREALRQARKRLEPRARWPGWKFPGERQIALPEAKFGAAALLRHLTPGICQYASNLLAAERAVVVGFPKRQAETHLRRALRHIVEEVVPASIPPQKEPARAKHYELCPGDPQTGARPIELVIDERGRIILRQPAFYAEPQGAAEGALGEKWELLRVGELRERLRSRIIKHLESDVVHIVHDRRTRRRLVDDYKRRHNCADDVIYNDAKVNRRDFYRWLQGERAKRPISNRSIVHRRLIRVLTSPARDGARGYPPLPTRQSHASDAS